MATGRPDSVEVWAPIFTKYFKREQLLNPAFAIVGDHCKLCDDMVAGDPGAHMRTHGKELTAWTAKKKREAEARSKQGLAAHRREQAMQRAAEEARDVIEHINDYPEEDNDD